MIRLTKPPAVRAALTIAHGAWENLAVVRLDPDGTLWATDGVVIIRSKEAHDADISEPLYVGAPKSYRTNGGEVGYRLDVGEGVLIEERPRSEREWQVEVSRGRPYPNVAAVMPGNLAKRMVTSPVFDSIRGGKVAEAYGLSLGVWGPGHKKDFVELEGLDDGDTIIMARVRRTE